MHLWNFISIDHDYCSHYTFECYCRACRHGDRCSRLHNRPTISPTILLHNLYMNPVLNAPLGPDGLPVPVDPEKVQQFFEDFYEDIFLELAKFGEIEHLCVCDNLADHMVGNVYVKYRDEESAARALQGLQGRFYAGKPIQVEFSPVTDFKESTCRQYEEGTCKRSGYCNFMHVRPVSRSLRKQLFGRYGDGSGGSTRFHDERRGGGRYDRYERRDRYDDRRRYDRDRRYRDNDRRRYDRRDDGRRGTDRNERRRRDSSEERRAQIAKWNSEAGVTANNVPNPPAAHPSNLYGAPAASNYGGQGEAPWNSHHPQAPMPYQASNGYQTGNPPAPLQQYQPYNQYQEAPGQVNGNQQRSRGGGGSGSNTVPITNMRSFDQQPTT